MALRQAGVELVVKNFSGFMSSLSRANKEIEKTGQVATRSAQQINAYGQKVADAQRLVENILGRVTKAENNLANVRQSTARSAESASRRQTASLKSIQDQVGNLTTAYNKGMRGLTIATDAETSATNRLKIAKKELKSLNSALKIFDQQHAAQIQANDQKTITLRNKIVAQIDKQRIAVMGLTAEQLKAASKVVSAQENLAKITKKLMDKEQERKNKIKQFAEDQQADAEKSARAIQNAEEDVNIALRNRKAAIDDLTRAQDELNAATIGGVGGGVGGGAGGGIFAAIKGNMGSIIAVLGVATAVIATAVAGFRLLGNAISGVANIVKTVLVGAFNLLSSTVQGIFSPIVSVFKKIGSAISSAITEKLKQVTTGLFDAVAEFQRFQILFVALQARDISNVFGIEMAEAFKRAVAPARELFSWVKQLAVTTPFTAKGITEVLAMANAMGLTTKEAKRLTEAVGNFTAGMGLTEEHMWRIIYNFGQMFAQGKVTGREFRDLAISFVPVWRMLDNMAVGTGKTTEEFKKLALEGGVPVLAFFDEFIRMANSDFPDAMERMARTWEGVVGNAKDFLQVIIGTNTIGPVFNKITAAMADSLQKLIRTLSPISEAIGYNLARALDVIKVGFLAITQVFDSFRSSAKKPVEPNIGAFVVAMQKMDDGTMVMTKTAKSMEELRKEVLRLEAARPTGFVNFIAKVAVFFREVGEAIASILKWIGENVIGSLKGVAKASGQWGYNIVAMIAYGMGKAVSLIVSVINYIAGIFEYWLGPGSAPRALPELPKWGMEAMAEYLRGFTLADFDALKGIQGPLKDALSILVDTGQIGKKAAAILYRDLSVAIAKAIATGVVEESLFEKIAKAAGPFGKEIAKLAKLHIQLAQATKALAEAEKALAAAQKKEAAARVAVNSKVREYNALLRAGADKAVLTAKLAEVNAAELAARAATEERKRQEELVEVFKAQVEALEDAVRLQEELVQQLLDITREQIIQIEADTGGAESALNDLLDKYEAAASELPPLPPINPINLDDIISDINWDQAMLDAEAWMKDIQALWADAFKPLTEAGGEFDKLGKAWGRLMKIFGGGDKSLKNGLPPSMFGPQKSNFDKLIDAFKGLNDEIDRLKGNFALLSASFGILTGTMGDPLGKAEFFVKVIGWLIDGFNALIYPIVSTAAMLAFLKLKWDELYQAIKPVLDWMEEKGAEIKDFFVELANSLTEFGDETENYFGPDGKVMMAFTGFNKKIQTMMAGFVAGMVAKAVQWGYDTWQTTLYHWDLVKKAVSDKAKEAKDKALEKLEELRLQAIFKIIDLKWAIIGKWEDIKEAIREKIQLARDIVKTAIKAIQGFFDSISESKFVTAIKNIIEKLWALYEAIKAALKLLGQKIAEVTGSGNAAGGGFGQFGAKTKPLTPLVVGEHGWEVFMPYAKGMILNQRQIADIIQVASSQAQGNTMPYLHRMFSMPAQSSTTVISNKQVNFNFGGVVIANEMDMVTFEARVRNVVRQEFE